MATPPNSRPGGVPQWRGKPPEAGVPKDKGVPRGAGKLPGQGLPVGAGKKPDEEGVVVKATPGQIDRGAPGQMDPWAENPWAPGEGGDAWSGNLPVLDPVDSEGDDFYLQHPNFQGETKDG